MPPSQLKRLKASLREQGITGPPPSNKQKKKNKSRPDQRVHRQAALENIRESFNPFEIKSSARPRKFDYTTNRKERPENARPGVTKSRGEELRRKSLLPEMKNRHRVGGIVDRRIGENDPTMTPEQKMLERFSREKLRKGASLFDLEEADEEELLTHMGQSIDVAGKHRPVRDDYDEMDDEAAGSDEGGFRRQKRKRDASEEAGDGEEEIREEVPERKKTKAEVMQEVIAKSKMYKYERQQAKEEDDDMRDELNKDWRDLMPLLKGIKGPPPKEPEPEQNESADPSMNPQRAAMIAGTDSRTNVEKEAAEIARLAAEKEYDQRMKQMLADQRAQPSGRTKTEEEEAKERADLLKELEEQRQRRMRGEEEPEDDDQVNPDLEEDDEDDEDGDAAGFGLKATRSRPLGIDDEDDFLLENDLIASGSDFGDEDSDPELSGDENSHDSEDKEANERMKRDAQPDSTLEGADPSSVSGLPFTYDCPRTHEAFLALLKKVDIADHPKVVQRIRASNPANVHPDNKQKLSDFSEILVEHIHHLGSIQPPPPIAVTNFVIRSVHSLARTYPDVISAAFRRCLSSMHEANDIKNGDLLILTAIGSIYPTSDHFHQVVTPATTIMARWLGLTIPHADHQLTTGAYLVALCIKYQQLSKRYVPEALRFTLVALSMKPVPSKAIIDAHVTNLLSMADLWSTLPAFPEIFSPHALTALTKLSRKRAITHLNILLSSARLSRRPLTLHNHRPLPIRTALPKWEENFNPDKHYDPDRERAESARLKKEYKRERKGAVRELRKDASFMARENLREKRERDKAYEERQRKLIAEIQGEEGHEGKEYEKERRKRRMG
ncbi:Nop14-like protein [Aulographum hederae CBS 113979]|uniref:Nop14-like protein n=1 Tax=Aulographum hederae CBS 113979 TaxID=1176131 RepID=A0A6G1HFS3_9PEZI|nr:Nop14-like protein [Aulographum hederae CBS 113979]